MSILRKTFQNQSYEKKKILNPPQDVRKRALGNKKK